MGSSLYMYFDTTPCNSYLTYNKSRLQTDLGYDSSLEPLFDVGPLCRDPTATTSCATPTSVVQESETYRYYCGVLRLSFFNINLANVNDFINGKAMPVFASAEGWSRWTVRIPTLGQPLFGSFKASTQLGESLF